MARQLNKLLSYLLTIKLGLLCLYFTGQAIILSFFNKNTLTKNNKIIKGFAHYILKPLKINFIHKNWQVLDTLSKDKPIIFMSNHSSLYDIPIILHNIPGKFNLRMLAKKELTKLPIFGQGMIKLNFPSVDRKNRKQAILDLEHTKQLMQKGITLWAAPEGTRSLDGSLLKFKKGVFVMAIELGATIVPVGIKGANKVMPAKSYNYSLGETVTLTLGEPLDTSKYTLDSRNEIVQKIREEISKNI